MKILIITLEYPPQTGGIASYVVNFAGHVLPDDVVVYAPRATGSQPIDDSHLWKVYRRRPYFWLWWPRWLRMVWQIGWIVSREHISQIQVHQVLPGGYVAWIVKKLWGIPYLVWLHGTDVGLATKHGGKRWLFKKVVEQAERIIVNSQFLRDKVKSSVELTTPITVVYPSPADYFFKATPPESLDKLRAKLALNGKKVIITVARLAEGKGYPHLIRLLPALLEKFPNLVWLIIGDGPKKTEIITQIAKNSLQNVVRFLGALPPEELPSYYQLADVFVLLTHSDEQAEESFGTVFLEAAAAGLPVVAGRAGGVEEAVEHQATGLVVDIHQPPIVIGAITELLNNQTYAKQLGAAGRKRVLDKFTWEKQLKKLEN